MMMYIKRGGDAHVPERSDVFLVHVPHASIFDGKQGEASRIRPTHGLDEQR